MSRTYAYARETELCTVTIGELSRRGVFRDPYSVAEVDRAGTRISVSYFPAHRTASLTIHSRERVSLKHVAIASRQLPFGEGFEFVCPCCGENRKMLILQGDELVCGTRFRAEGAGSHSGRRRALRDAREARKLAQRVSCTPVDSAEPHARRRRRKDELSTEWAIKFALGASQLNDFLEYQEVGRPLIESSVVADFEAPLDRAPMEGFPALDVNELQREGCLRSGELRAWRLGWKRYTTEGFSLTLIVDLRPEFEPAIFIARRARDSRWADWLHLPLRRRGGAAPRWTFVCPVEGAPAEVVYFRASHFASRRAQRLYYS